MKKSHGTQAAVGALRRMSRSCSTSAPSARKASRCGSSRRRPITSPPGGGSSACRSARAAARRRRNEARMRSASVGVDLGASARRRPAARPSLPSRRSTRTPRASSSASIASVSRMRGTLWRTTSSSVSSERASSGSAAFLLPAGTTVPDSGTPPSMTNFSMSGTPAACSGRGDWPTAGPRGWARVTAMSWIPSREEAWTLFCEWTASPSLRKHVLAVEAALRAYARRFGEDEELLGASSGLLHDLDYERYPGPRDRATRARRSPSSSAVTPTPSSCARSPRTRTSSASRATRCSRSRCTRSTSSRAS